MSSTQSPLDEQEVRRPRKLSVAVVVIVAMAVMGVLTYAGWTTMSQGTSGPPPPTLPTTLFPLGTLSSTEPSGYAPPSATALAGFAQSYVNDFTVGQLPAGWYLFHGLPGGDPGGQFGPQHVKIRSGMLQLTAYRDSQYQNRWVTGGLCQCGAPSLYGAFFVRSRATGVGPNEVQLLWPSNNQWPPEIDFNESPSAHATSATLHWGRQNFIQQWHKHGIDMLAWHTWGVVWTPKKIVYTVDGHAWGITTNASAIPSLPMTLDLEQRTECTLHVQCPNAPVQMLVDWVAEYKMN